jgi:hypothetical protein
MKILEHNIETGEAIERDATAEELAQMKIDKAKYKAEEQARTAKAAAKASAIAKLEALGLNLDEAQAIIGQ